MYGTSTLVVFGDIKWMCIRDLIQDLIIAQLPVPWISEEKKKIGDLMCATEAEFLIFKTFKWFSFPF